MDIAMKISKPLVPESLKSGARIILADPPWSTNQRGARGAGMKYPLMTTEQIKAMPVNDLAAEDSLLALWCFNSNLPEALEVMKAWGFRYVTKHTSIKFRLGMGHYLRECDETILIGVKGHFKVSYHSQPSWGFFPVMEHSRKPQETFAMLERLAGEQGPFIELFARRKTHNWYAWGNEVPGGADFVLPGYPVPEYSDEVKAEIDKLTTSKGAK